MKRMLVLGSVFLLLYVAINVYIGWHVQLFLYHAAGLRQNAMFWTIYFIVACSYLLARFPLLPRLGLAAAARLLKVIGSYYIGFFYFALLLLVAADIVGGILVLMGMELSIVVLTAGRSILMLLFVIFIFGSYNAWSPVIRRHELSIDKPLEVGAASKRLRVLAVSDLHLGNLVGNRQLKKLVAIAERERPDLILFPGDVIDDSLEPFIRNRMADTLKHLKAPEGMYAVLGNHEYYGGHITDYVGRMSEIGITVLVDETVQTTSGLQIAGRKDYAAKQLDPAGRQTVEELLEGLSKDRPILMLDHQPKELEQAAKGGVDLLLCGHTHRGQFIPNHWITRRLFELDYGYKLKDSLHVFVSSGFGTWGPPLRLGSRSEVLVIDLTFTG